MKTPIFCSALQSWGSIATLHIHAYRSNLVQKCLEVRRALQDLVARVLMVHTLGSPVVPFYPFSFWVPFLKPNSRKKGTLIIKGLLGNLVQECPAFCNFQYWYLGLLGMSQDWDFEWRALNWLPAYGGASKEERFRCGL